MSEEEKLTIELKKLSKPKLISIILELQVDLRTCRLDNAELE